MCLQNIRLFLDTCRRELGFRERDLFDPYMLFDKYDLDKVKTITSISFFLSNSFLKIIETLSKISRSEIAIRKKLTPFPLTNPVNYINVSKEDDTGILPIMRSLDESIPIQE